MSGLLSFNYHLVCIVLLKLLDPEFVGFFGLGLSFFKVVDHVVYYAFLRALVQLERYPLPMQLLCHFSVLFRHFLLIHHTLSQRHIALFQQPRPIILKRQPDPFFYPLFLR